MNVHYKIAQWILRIYLYVFWNLSVDGLEHISQKHNVIVCANHDSFFDPPFLGAILPFETYFLAKKELFSHKIFALILQFFNAIPIKRGGFSRAALHQSVQLLLAGNNLVIFPEGSRRSTRAKSGISLIAQKTAATIYPVRIENITHFQHCFFRKKKLHFIIQKPLYPEKYMPIIKEKGYVVFAEEIMERIRE